MQVDPDNRLVAATLEGEWNEKLRRLADAQEECERRREADRVVLDQATKDRLHAIVTEFPLLWQDPATPMREKKRMARLLIEDVTIERGIEIGLHVRFRGGATRTVTVPAPLPVWKLRQTSREVVAEIDRLLDGLTDKEIAAELDRRGHRAGAGGRIHRLIVRNIRQAYGLKSRYHRLREKGFLTIEEIAQRLGANRSTVRRWRLQGRVTAHRYDDKGNRLYEPPGPKAPKKYERVTACARERSRSSSPHVS
jgi:excisionase family DNA binding protein